MTNPSLLELQRLDARIEESERRLAGFGPLLAEVAEPASVLSQEVETTEARIRDMKIEERRVERTVEERRGRAKKLEKRLDGVRNLREEAAVRAELDIVRRALDADEQEALTLLDQIRRLEDRLEEEERALLQAEDEIEPTRRELLESRERAEGELERLREEREAYADRLGRAERSAYDRVRAGGRRIAVRELTDAGACGRCFGMVPLQRQNEIRHGTETIRCEFCGVILAVPERREAVKESG